jgi:hypothetical protein
MSHCLNVELVDPLAVWQRRVHLANQLFLSKWVRRVGINQPIFWRGWIACYSNWCRRRVGRLSHRRR